MQSLKAANTNNYVNGLSFMVVMMFVVLWRLWVVEIPEGVRMIPCVLLILFPEDGFVISMMAASVVLLLLSLFMLRLLDDVKSVEELVC